MISHSHIVRLAALLSPLLLGACASVPFTQAANEHAFRFDRDTIAFGNQLTYEYHVDPAAGTTRMGARNADADYTLHCFVLARSTRQFYQFARFAPEQPAVDDARYRRLIRAVVSHDPDEASPLPQRIEIPGYADLRSFSSAKERLLKEELGGAVQSYFQRGNWRMVFPFTKGNQQQTAANLLAEVRADRPPVVHLFTFPKLSINHAVLLYGAIESGGGIRFIVYDPNHPDQPGWLDFDGGDRVFRFPQNDYFAGGSVKVYEVYRSAWY